MTAAEISGGMSFTATGTLEQVSNAFGQLMTAEGYKLESGDASKGTYGVGNSILRLLLGAFHKRYTFDFEVKSADGKTVLNVLESSFSKASGGIIGYKKYKNEMSRLTGLISALQI